MATSKTSSTAARPSPTNSATLEPGKTDEEIPTAPQSSQEKETAILRPAVPQSVPSTSTTYDLPEPLENMQQVGKGKNTDVDETDEPPVKRQALSLSQTAHRLLQ